MTFSDFSDWALILIWVRVFGLCGFGAQAAWRSGAQAAPTRTQAINMVNAMKNTKPELLGQSLPLEVDELLAPPMVLSPQVLQRLSFAHLVVHVSLDLEHPLCKLPRCFVERELFPNFDERSLRTCAMTDSCG